MRVVIDTNILVSGLLSAKGPPAHIVDALLQGRLIPIMSTATVTELETVLHRAKLRSAFARAGVDPTAFLEIIRAMAHLVVPQPTSIPIRDAHDRIFLALLPSQPPPRYFVTGDMDFDAPEYNGVPVISAAAFARLLKQS